MAEEPHSNDPHASQEQQPDWDQPPEEERLQRLADLQELVENDLHEMEDVSQYHNLWKANSFAYDTLWGLVLMCDDIATSPVDPRLVEPGQQIRGVLPFNDDEFAGLVARMKPYEDPSLAYEPDKWYEEATTEDIVLLERWRRWLIESFHETNPGEPGSEGLPLMTAIERTGRILGEIV